MIDYKLCEVYEETFNIVKLKQLIEYFNNNEYVNNVLLKYLNRNLQIEGDHATTEIQYKQTNNCSRYFARGLSLQNIPVKVRGYISADIYNDLDIVNCHPVLAYHYLYKEFEYDSISLLKYNNNREKIINDLLELNPDLTRAEIKKTILSMLYYGKKDYSKIHNKTDWLINFNAEINGIYKLIYKKKFSKGDNEMDFNLIAKWLNKQICKIENDIIQVIIKHYELKNVVLCFDGLMIPKHIKINIKKLEKLIHKKLDIKIKLIIKDFDIWDGEEDIINERIEEFNDEFVGLNTEYYNERYTKAFDDIPTQFIKEIKGSGKSEQLSVLIKKYKPEKILCITFRKTLSNELKKRLPDFVNYQDILNANVKTIGDEHKRVIIQAESLHKLRWSNCDLLILDEIVSLEKQFLSLTTMKNKTRANFTRYQSLIRESRNVICMDADINRNTINHILAIRKKEYKLRINEYRNTTKKITFICGKQNGKQEHLYQQIIDDLKNDKKIVIASNRNCDFNKALYEVLLKETNKKILLITSATIKNEDIQKILLNVEDDEIGFGKYDCVIYSPTIQAGVSFNKPHFDKFYGIFSSHMHVNSIRQMIDRVRQFKDDEFIYFLTNEKIKDKISVAQFERHLSLRRKFNDYSIDIPDIIPFEETLSGDINIPYKDGYYYMWRDAQVELLNDKADFVNRFKKAEIENGCLSLTTNWQEMEVKDDSIEEKIEHVEKEIKLIEATNIANAPDINEVVCKSIIKKIESENKTTADEIYMVKKYNIRKTYNMYDIPVKPELLIEFDKKKIKPLYKNLNVIYYIGLEELINKERRFNKLNNFMMTGTEFDEEGNDMEELIMNSIENGNYHGEIEDITKNYVSRKHYICHKLLNFLGFSGILDDKTIDSHTFKEKIRDNKQYLSQDVINEICDVFEIRDSYIPNAENMDLRSTLDFINGKLKPFYGINIKQFNKKTKKAHYKIEYNKYIEYKKTDIKTYVNIGTEENPLMIYKPNIHN
jgi:hypothetical protein